MSFEVIVKEDSKESNLKKGEVVTVYDIDWHKATTVEGKGFIFFLIYNQNIDRFIYEEQGNFRPRYADERPKAH